MLRRSAWLQVLLTAYLWLVASVPLGNWNRQRDPQLIPALLQGQGIGAGDLALLAFISLPAVLFWLAYKSRWFWSGVAALLVDVVWLGLQIQSWWIPYVLGTSIRWQLEYAKGPTTKVLPSFGNHVAPDGMHFAIHVLLVAALITGVVALRQMRRNSQGYGVK
ncbi:MAG TPA: hypothetical protein VEU11_20035 [Terriglobales bacterium]|nr:hypothetical protein [Terriglobales bacterium]